MFRRTLAGFREARLDGFPEFISVKQTADIYDDHVRRRVAVYVRVSTDDPSQTGDRPVRSFCILTNIPTV